MGNRFMRVMVFFDLPVSTSIKRRDYTLFRKFLINEGYIMLQYSVYSKTVRNNNDASRHIHKLERNLPKEGSVRAMIVTEKQYAKMFLLVGERLKSENLLDTKELIEL